MARPEMNGVSLNKGSNGLARSGFSCPIIFCHYISNHPLVPYEHKIQRSAERGAPAESTSSYSRTGSPSSQKKHQGQDRHMRKTVNRNLCPAPLHDVRVRRVAHPSPALNRSDLGNRPWFASTGICVGASISRDVKLKRDILPPSVPTPSDSSPIECKPTLYNHALAMKRYRQWIV